MRLGHGSPTAVAGWAAVVAAALVLPIWVAPAQATVDEDDVCVAVRPDGDYPTPPTDATSESETASPMRLTEAHRYATGKGVGVAVIDTGLAPGVAESGRLDARSPVSVPGVRTRVHDAHGTWVAGLVAGHQPGQAIGVAPDAHVVPIRVADAGRRIADESADDVILARVTADGIARGIRLAMAAQDAENIRVINISLSVREDSGALRRAVRAATAAGILVVAASGNRPQPEGTEDYADGFTPGEDRVPFPARYDEVLAVTALAPDLTLAPAYVETGPGIDVSAPAVGAKTVGVEGQTCLLPTIATSWAAAQVSGLAALLFERYDDITAAQVRARIEATAQGARSGRSLDGHGMVQPVAALTAELEISSTGEVIRGERDAEQWQPLETPAERADELPAARDRLRWWGLLAGGGLVLALLLRPLVRSVRD